MAHNIHFNEGTGEHAFFSVKQKAWHGLGQVVQDYPTSAQAMRFAGLDYEVEKRPLFTLDTANHNGDTDLVIPEIRVPNYYATVRTDNEKVFGVVGRDYEIVQNADAFAFFDSIVGGGEGIMYETAGALGDGERVFITAKLPGYIRVGNGDDVTEKYIFLTTAHDGSGSITAAFTPIRIVCQNTLNGALRNMTNVVRIRHTTGAKERFADAQRIMGLANTLSGQLEDIFNGWSKVRITDREVFRLIQLAMAPNRETLQALKGGADDKLSAIYKNTCEDAFRYAMMSESQRLDTTKGTVFGAYNAVTGYFQNVRKYRSDDDKVKSLLMGGTAQSRANTAFELCTAFEKHGADALVLS